MLKHNFPLIKYNTFGLDCRVSTFISLKTEEEAVKLLSNPDLYSKPLLILGGGSNLLFLSYFNGTVLHPEIQGIALEGQTEDHVVVSAGAGKVWDDFVEWTVERGFGGLENLSFIPGTVGATPVQNIGAYGVEVRDTIEKVRAISLSDGTIREFNNGECQFGYRDSIFKNELKGKYLITKVYYRLSKKPVLNTGYGSLQEEARKLGTPSIKTVRESVIKIRKSKLPDPGIVGNAGSFFRNPVVSYEESKNLKKVYPGIPLFPNLSGEIKLAAGWLIEKCGWKGKRIGEAGVHDKQALVLVNYGKATGKEIFDLSEKIRISVFEKFGIELEREVEVIGIS
jgi:UDP-N-acetylmuramate dehydrogenase